MAFHLRSSQISANNKTWIVKTLLLPLSAFCAIYLVGLITAHFISLAQSPIIAASLGASAVILLITPGSTFSKPWSLIGGHLVSALIGISCAISIPDAVLSSAVAVGGSMLVMELLHCMNPPGAATALAPVISPHNPESFNHYLLLPPLMLNVILLVIFSVLINRLLRFLN